MEYVRLELRDELVVRRLISFSYKELSNDYSHQGESHDFWEFAYLDKGEVWITTETGEHALNQGDLVFYRPNEFHSLRTNRVTAPNLFIVAFDCYSPVMDLFGGRVFALREEERRLIALLIEEGSRVFDRPIQAPRVEALRRAEHVPFGAEQLLRLYLETLLILLARKSSSREIAAPAKLPSLLQHNKDSELSERVTAYMQAHLADELTLDLLCAEFSVGKSQLKKAFKSSHGAGVMETFAEMKMWAAKTMIRETSFNLTEIGERLGYNSIHSFSKAFKKATGMTPSEYTRSAKALARTPSRSRLDTETPEPFVSDYC